MRKHLPVLLIVPLFVIVMTWPAFIRVFDSDEFWLRTWDRDIWLNYWNAWHVESVLAGEADYYYSDAIFHPLGLSLAFKHIALPHALLFVALERLMPADDVYSLLYLLMLCFNAFGAYVLIQHLLQDEWSALFGALVAGASPYFLQGSTTPDLILTGTLPLTIYCLHRAVLESRWRFAALAGFCAGFSAFISLYIFVFTLITAAVYVIYLGARRWRQRGFWRLLLCAALVCAVISAFRLYPMLADRALLSEGLASYHGRIRSNDALDYFIHSENPLTAGALHSLFNTPAGAAHERGYLGYINLLLLVCALLQKPFRRSLLPWLATLVFFGALRLGHYLTFNGIEHESVVLPERVLSDHIPAIFGAIGLQEYYQPAMVVPLALLSSYGLARLLQARSVRMRALVLLAAALILAIEFHVPRAGHTLAPNKTAYIGWLRAEPEAEAIKLINLPQQGGNPHYHLFLQTLAGYPQAFGFSSRTPESARAYIDGNLLLRRWDKNRNVHCLPHNEAAFMSAVERLLTDGFSHVVVHKWRWADHLFMHSFANAPAAYDDGEVSVYRLLDMRGSCQSARISPPALRHFARSPWATPGPRSAILSFHPSQAIDPDHFQYLTSLFSEWQRLTHLYLEADELMMQGARGHFAADGALAASLEDSDEVFLLYNRDDSEASLSRVKAALGPFDACQRLDDDAGSVVERYLSRQFDCALFTASDRLGADYDNGARLEHALLEATQDALDVQLLWGRLPSEPHSISLQVFDDAGAKALGYDAAFGLTSLARHRVDISALEPGDYAVKLIVYNFHTGESVSGKLSQSSVRFERELQIAAIERS